MLQSLTLSKSSSLLSAFFALKSKFNFPLVFYWPFFCQDYNFRRGDYIVLFSNACQLNFATVKNLCFLTELHPL